MSERATDYQEQVTGSPLGIEYVVDGVAFDGFRDGRLKDAKGPGYEQFLDESGEWKPSFKGAAALVEQARRQLDARRVCRPQSRCWARAAELTCSYLEPLWHRAWTMHWQFGRHWFTRTTELGDALDTRRHGVGRIVTNRVT
ncbi:MULTISPECIES: Tox-REase-5 domain-containing protein [unclassified Rhodococcus (in: high G+C Gram-positive bacteria)]|uniref:Tox-REase-5 domain-containing protein n=1 Tax=unclassified Rhodococcus (in: high G+C Gram-positive bacteria) TaxID=192944 RepID=UPI0035948344